jgi:alpha-tubulin suppressor-like RCC1 family protein
MLQGQQKGGFYRLNYVFTGITKNLSLGATLLFYNYGLRHCIRFFLEQVSIKSSQGGFMNKLAWSIVSLSLTAVLAACGGSNSVSGVSIAVAKVALNESQTTDLQATVLGAGSFKTDVTWAVEPIGVGLLSSDVGNGVSYQAPASTFGQVVRITATSVQDPSQKKAVLLSINPIKNSIGVSTHSLAIKADGTLLSWGSDTNGQLGNDLALEQKPTPVTVNGASSIVAVSAGIRHSLALKSDGTLLSWGDDSDGQLGDDLNKANKALPVAVSGATGIVAISAGGFHSLALKSNGTLLSWGNDSNGQLGDDDSLTSKSIPVIVSGATGIVAIAAGGNFSLALKSDGTLLSWGDDFKGQLGDAEGAIDRPTPVAVSGVTNVIAITAGYEHALALKSDGTLLSWGFDGAGQLGDDVIKATKFTPVVVSGATGIVAISAGQDHSLALKSDSTMLSWGADSQGQLGDNATFEQKPTPVAVSGVTGIVTIAAGTRHSLALKSDGTLLTWGGDNEGQLGDDVTLADKPIPISVLLGVATIRLP